MQNANWGVFFDVETKESDIWVTGLRCGGHSFGESQSARGRETREPESENFLTTSSCLQRKRETRGPKNESFLHIILPAESQGARDERARTFLTNDIILPAAKYDEFTRLKLQCFTKAGSSKGAETNKSEWSEVCRHTGRHAVDRVE